MDSVTLFGETFVLPLTNEAKCELTEWIVDPDSSARAWEALEQEAIFAPPDRVFLLTLCLWSVLRDSSRQGGSIGRDMMARALKLARSLEGQERATALWDCAYALHNDFQDADTALAVLEEAEQAGEPAHFMETDDIRREAAIRACFRREWERSFTLAASIQGAEHSEYIFSQLGDLLLEMEEWDQALRLATFQGDGWDHFGPLHLKILRHVFASMDWELAEQILKKIAANPLGVTEQELRFCDRILTLPLGARPEEVRRLQHWYGYGTLGEGMP